MLQFSFTNNYLRPLPNWTDHPLVNLRTWINGAICTVSNVFHLTFNGESADESVVPKVDLQNVSAVDKAWKLQNICWSSSSSHHFNSIVCDIAYRSNISHQDRVVGHVTHYSNAVVDSTRHIDDNWLSKRSGDLFIIGMMPQSGKLPVLDLLTDQKSGFSPAGAIVAPIQVNLCRTDGHLGPLGCAKFHVNRCWRVGMRTPK